MISLRWRPSAVVHLGRVCSRLGQLVPLAVLAGVHDLAGLLFQAFEDDDFGLELWMVWRPWPDRRRLSKFS
jgi:hypothetical protein